MSLHHGVRFVVLSCAVQVAILASPALAQIHPLDPSMLTISSDPNVLVSRHYGLAWYRAGIPIAGRTLADLDTVCAGVKSRVGGPWRAPTREELETLSYKIWPRQFDPSRAFHDTPDRRHFGRLVPPPRSSGYFLFPAKDWAAQGGGLYTYVNMKLWGTGGIEFDTEFARAKTEVRYTTGDRLLCVSDRTAVGRR